MIPGKNSKPEKTGHQISKGIFMHSYRYPSRLAAIYAALLIVLLGLCFYNGAGDLQYTVVWMIVLSPFLLFALCRLLITLLRRVEVDDDRIRYRGLLGSKTFEFSPEMELYVARGLFRCLLVCRLHWTVIRLRDDDGNRLRIALHWQAAEEIVEAIETIAQMPTRPAMIGIPQDVAEMSWIPINAVVDVVREFSTPLANNHIKMSEDQDLSDAISLIAQAKKPVILIDDYALKYSGIVKAIDIFSKHINAPVLQLRYRRGPMLFERLRYEYVHNFVGWLNQFSKEHRELVAGCDLFITIEDRNIYRRVVGDLPESRKIAITGFPEKTIKNDYISESDVIVEASPTETMLRIVNALPPKKDHQWWSFDIERAARVTPEPADELVEYQRTGIVQAVGSAFVDSKQPVLVDDSQMFGGIISERYDLLPKDIRVFGSHGGFVGSGVSVATGIAIVERDCSVVCTLGDQGFTNSIQGLICAIEQEAPITYIVCNNGMSVSLTKQANATDSSWFDGGKRGYLKNTPKWSYVGLARSLGMFGVKVSVPIGPDEKTVAAGIAELHDAVAQCKNHDGPKLIELVLPSEPAAWRGIWLTQGFEQVEAITS